MQDGGTLGEVIAALRKQKQYRVIQEISDLAEEFLDVYNTYHKENLRSSETGGPAGPHLYSILRTLCDTFQKAGQEDPLGKFQLYSGGFKQYMRSRDVTVNSGFNMQQFQGGKEGSNEDSGYTSPHRYIGNKKTIQTNKQEKKKKKKKQGLGLHQPSQVTCPPCQRPP